MLVFISFFLSSVFEICVWVACDAISWMSPIVSDLIYLCVVFSGKLGVFFFVVGDWSVS